MLRRLAIAIAVIAALVAGLVLVSRRMERGGSRGAPAVSRVGEAPAPTSNEQALEALSRIADASQRLMPQGYEGVFVSMPIDALRRARPNVRRDTSDEGRRPGGPELWQEDDASGARVVYFVGARAHILTQVQFMSQLDTTDGIVPHLAALRARYGSPTGVWDCPETPEASPTRRFTWRREGASLVDAVLIHGNSVALTLIIAANDDIARSLVRGQCAPVRDENQLTHFPVAGELRGERTPFIREVPHPRDE